jgi:hypothetical protein
VLGFLAPAVPAADEPDATDTPQHEERVLGSSGEEYLLQMGGTLDSLNTRSPTRINSHPWEQAYQPMRLVRLENIGDTDIVNPWVEVNGRARWRTLDEIVNSALRAIGEPGTLSDAEKARALYEFHRAHRFHASPGDYENHDAVKMFNVYGYGLCGDSAPVLMELWRAAGLKTRRGFPMGHCTSEVWYDGAWHLLDGDVQTLVLRTDNTTIAGEEDLVRDHNLLRRMGGPFEGQAPLYTFVGTHSGEFFSHAGHAMNLTLRPGEALEWRWGDAQKHHYSADLDPETYMMASVHLRENWGPRAWSLVENGKWVYQPPLRTPAGRAGAIAENIRWRGDGDTLAVTPEKPGQRSSLTWKIEAPYVMVGGSLNARLRCSRADRCAFLFSEDGAEWQPIAEASGENAQIRASLDPYFPNKGAARYRYFLRLEMLAESNVDEIGVESIAMENDLQMAPLAMPTLQLGENRVRFVADSGPAVSARVTFDWVERSSAREPDAPAAPILPRDQSDIDGTRFTFRWEQARSNDAAAISDYHFQLSDRPDMRWALAANFDLMVSQTATRGTASFDLAEPGLLNPGQRYYWRVRAKTEKGVWGPWSRIWSFVPRGPGVPLHVQLRPAGDQYELVWEANPNGDRPAHYEIYASNEKGFRTSDAPYEVNAGNQPSQGLFPGQRQVTLPANHLTRVEASPLSLLPEHAFYRVVAVDAKGVRSGASDYAAAPRPFIYTKPPSEAKLRKELTYEAKTVVSIGDLTYRAFGANPDSYQLAYWDADQPVYTLLEEEPRCGHPDAIWASIDPKTGVLSGRPNKPAVYHINIQVEIPGVGKHVQSFGLRVGE